MDASLQTQIPNDSQSYDVEGINVHWVQDYLMAWSYHLDMFGTKWLS